MPTTEPLWCTPQVNLLESVADKQPELASRSDMERVWNAKVAWLEAAARVSHRLSPVARCHLSNLSPLPSRLTALLPSRSLNQNTLRPMLEKVSAPHRGHEPGP